MRRRGVRSVFGMRGDGDTVLSHANWAALGRGPYLLETSLPGVFAVGDVRANSVKRVAAAVGEGSMAVRLVQQYLGQVG
jgi:thioredoxin reductase (NADPH)